ncbi:uncharacterized protein LOC121728336 [Aricia agestis]|uniref:uncharacterized protein LOC121728336 n=1 Tax=Aricia agestis TaxID=91739 RepID=UPI001C20AFBC|nr:uncharacterized protein LOC121728336 [Aricia agestis]
MISDEPKPSDTSDDAGTNMEEPKSRIDEIYNEIIQTRLEKKSGKALKKNNRKKNYNETSKLNEKTYNVWMMEAARSLATNYRGEDSPPLGEPLKYEPDRNDFVKKVFTILFVMLAATAGYLILVFFIPELKYFYLSVPIYVFIAGLLVMMCLNYLLVCVPSARVGCCSYICLLVAVVAMSNIAAAITVRYRTHIVVCAFIATTAVVLVCILLACSRFDFTKFYIYVIAAAMVFMTVAFLVAIAMLVYGVRYKPVELVLLFVGALLNVTILIMELQMVLGGKSLELTENEHAFGAYLLYTSIVDIFLRFVQIIGLIDE